mmetsp:Transcript_7483/g.11098  ORF Transcript_7483/g.11098 Transcript_7483/m.11098 type:complete len:394 (-) Transcript_7483:1913-3094(-)
MSNRPVREGMISGINKHINGENVDNKGSLLVENDVILKPKKKKYPFCYRFIRGYDKCQLTTMTIVYYIQLIFMVLIFFGLKQDIGYLKRALPQEGLSGNILYLNGTIAYPNNHLIPNSVINSTKVTSIYCEDSKTFIFNNNANEATFRAIQVTSFRPPTALFYYFRETTSNEAFVEFHEWPGSVPNHRVVKVGCLAIGSFFSILFNSAIGAVLIIVSTFAMKSKVEEIVLGVKVFLYDGLIKGKKKKYDSSEYEQCNVCGDRLSVSNFNRTFFGNTVCNQHTKHSTFIKGVTMMIFYVFYIIYLLVDINIMTGGFLNIYYKVSYSRYFLLSVPGIANIPNVLIQHYIIKITMYYCKKNGFLMEIPDDDEEEEAIDSKEMKAYNNGDKQNTLKL